MARSTERQPWLPFRDRDDAGRRLARKLRAFGGRHDAVALGLARGGVPIAATAANRLALPFGALIVRKLGVPGSPEVAYGALAAYGNLVEPVYLPRTLARLRREGLRDDDLDVVEAAERAELARRQELYLRGTPQPVAGRTVLLCDDGLATGATMMAAVSLMRKAGAAVVVACVPAGPADTCRRLVELADDVVCLQPRRDLRAVSEAYRYFGQVSDDEVLALLRKA